MQRRRFSQLLAMTALPLPARVLAQATDTDFAGQFARALDRSPWLAGWGNIEHDHYHGEATLTGHWPEQLVGTLYRTGPARHQVWGYRNHHWFDGDGMMQAWRIRPDGIRHQARLVQTAKVQAEDAVARALYPGLVAAPPDPEQANSPDDMNLANTSVLHHHGRLLALWEAGSPYEMDPQNLGTRGLYRFPEQGGGSSLAGVPFSAHPRVDVDGSLWNFGYASAAGLLVFWHIGADGRLLQASRLAVQPMTMPHDFVVTERHLVLLLPPFHYRPELEAVGFLGKHHWHPQDPCRVLVVDKADLSSHFFVELPAQWIFHFGNGWEDQAGIIRFDAARSENPGILTRHYVDLMRGQDTMRTAVRPYRYRLDTRKRTVAEEPLCEPRLWSEFPVIDPRVSCRRYRRLLSLTLNAGQPAIHGSLHEVSLFDLETGQRDCFRYPDEVIPEEHLVLPQPGSAPESRAWVLGSAYDWQRGCSVLNLFDADALADGPVASAALPYAIPLGLHGRFVTG